MASSRASGSIRRVRAVAGLTFREAWRRWVVIAAIVMTVAFLGLYGTGLFFAARDMRSTMQVTGESDIMFQMIGVQMMQLALMPASLIVGLTAVFASVSSISGDLDSGVLYGVATRPVRRGEIVLGKFIGVGTMLVVYALFLVGAVIGLTVLNFQIPLHHVVAALALFALEPLVLLGVSLLGSARLPTLANGVMMMALYGLSFIGGVVEQIGSLIPNQVMLNIGIVTSLVMPIDAVHRMATSQLIPPGMQLMSAGQGAGFGASATPSVWMALYALGYVALAVLLAASVFKRRDL